MSIEEPNKVLIVHNTRKSALAYAIFILSAAMFTPPICYILSSINASLVEDLSDNGMDFPLSTLLFIPPSLCFSSVFSFIIMAFFAKRAYGLSYYELNILMSPKIFSDNVSRRAAQFYSLRRSIIIFLFIGIILTGMDFRCHAFVKDNKLFVSGMFSAQREFNILELQTILEAPKITAPAGNVVDELGFEMIFKSGAKWWNSTLPVGADPQKTRRFIEWSSHLSGVPIKQTPVLERGDLIL